MRKPYKKHDVAGGTDAVLPGGYTYEIHEVYYDEGEIDGWTERAVGPYSWRPLDDDEASDRESVQELLTELEWMKRACMKPILEEGEDGKLREVEGLPHIARPHQACGDTSVFLLDHERGTCVNVGDEHRAMVYPRETTTYTLVVVGLGGSDFRNWTMHVREAKETEDAIT